MNREFCWILYGDSLMNVKNLQGSLPFYFSEEEEMWCVFSESVFDLDF